MLTRGTIHLLLQTDKMNRLSPSDVMANNRKKTKPASADSDLQEFGTGRICGGATVLATGAIRL